MRCVSYALIVVGLITTQLSNGGDMPADDNAMKICLAFAFEAQIAIHDETQAYASTPEALKIQDDKYCRDLTLTIPKADKMAFVVMARSERKVWTVDQSKTMRQIQ